MSVSPFVLCLVCQTLRHNRFYDWARRCGFCDSKSPKAFFFFFFSPARASSARSDLCHNPARPRPAPGSRALAEIAFKLWLWNFRLWGTLPHNHDLKFSHVSSNPYKCRYLLTPISIPPTSKPNLLTNCFNKVSLLLPVHEGYRQLSVEGGPVTVGALSRLQVGRAFGVLPGTLLDFCCCLAGLLSCIVSTSSLQCTFYLFD